MLCRVVLPTGCRTLSFWSSQRKARQVPVVGTSALTFSLLLLLFLTSYKVVTLRCYWNPSFLLGELGEVQNAELCLRGTFPNTAKP